MIWMYFDGRVTECTYDPSTQKNCSFTVEIFEHLTGKRINWEPRTFTKVITRRIGGHIKIFDEKFISGQEYKHGYKIYKCEHVNEDGTALLIPRGNALKAITARDTKDWEII